MPQGGNVRTKVPGLHASLKTTDVQNVFVTQSESTKRKSPRNAERALVSLKRSLSCSEEAKYPKLCEWVESNIEGNLHLLSAKVRSATKERLSLDEKSPRPDKARRE